MTAATTHVLTGISPRLTACMLEIDDHRDALAAATERRDRIIIEAVDQGMTQRSIAEATGISRARIIAILANYG